MTKNFLIVLLAIALVFLVASQKRTPERVQPDSLETSTTDTKPVNEVNLIEGNSLDLSSQNLQKLPQSALSDTSLELLDISNNEITGALPSEIGKLKNLRKLDASDNAMTGVPAEVGQLSKLEVLDLSNNQLTGLPYELGNLKNLKVLNLAGNDYSSQDLEVIKKGLPQDVEIIVE